MPTQSRQEIEAKMNRINRIVFQIEGSTIFPWFHLPISRSAHAGTHTNIIKQNGIKGTLLLHQDLSCFPSLR